MVKQVLISERFKITPVVVSSKFGMKSAGFFFQKSCHWFGIFLLQKPQPCNMNTVELDVRPIPQLYGSSYRNEPKGSFSTPPSSVVRGSCLTASLEMMVDWIKGVNRKGAYSIFRNASFLNKHAKQGHPNGDEMTHLMWNQATLHFTIYSSAQRLIELLDFFELPTRTISMIPPARAGRLETCEHALSKTAIKNRIVDILVNDKKPVIALVADMRIRSEYHQHKDKQITPFSDMPPSFIAREKTPQGHAVVLSGIDCDTGHLLVLDPSPSIELENHPERFHTLEERLSNPNIHRHKVALDDFVRCLQNTRSLITFDMDTTAELIKSHIDQIVKIGRTFGIDLYANDDWGYLPGSYDGKIISLDANTCIEFADHDLSNDHLFNSIDSAADTGANLLLIICQSDVDAAFLKNKIESNFKPKINNDDPDIIVISRNELENFL